MHSSFNKKVYKKDMLDNLLDIVALLSKMMLSAMLTSCKACLDNFLLDLQYHSVQRGYMLTVKKCLSVL